MQRKLFSSQSVCWHRRLFFQRAFRSLESVCARMFVVQELAVLSGFILASLAFRIAAWPSPWLVIDNELPAISEIWVRQHYGEFK